MLFRFSNQGIQDFYGETRENKKKQPRSVRYGGGG
jgi:hypothetical protein